MPLWYIYRASKLINRPASPAKGCSATVPNLARVPNLDNASGYKASKKLRNLFKLNSIKAKLKETTTVANYRPASHTRVNSTTAIEPTLWGLPRCKNLWSFFFVQESLFTCSILFRGSLLSWSFFVLRHWWVSQVFTPRMSRVLDGNLIEISTTCSYQLGNHIPDGRSPFQKLYSQLVK